MIQNNMLNKNFMSAIDADTNPQAKPQGKKPNFHYTLYLRMCYNESKRFTFFRETPIALKELVIKNKLVFDNGFIVFGEDAICIEASNNGKVFEYSCFQADVVEYAFTAIKNRDNENNFQPKQV